MFGTMVAHIFSPSIQKQRQLDPCVLGQPALCTETLTQIVKEEYIKYILWTVKLPLLHIFFLINVHILCACHYV